MILRILLYGILFYFIARFITRFVLPIFQITRAAQNKMKEMQQQMEQMQQQEQARQNAPRNKSVEGDYIDYEEIK